MKIRPLAPYAVAGLAAGCVVCGAWTYCLATVVAAAVAYLTAAARTNTP